MANCYRTLKYFQKLDDFDYQAILRCFHAKFQEIQKGNNIVNIGDKTDYIYIIAEGHARSQAYDINGKTTIFKDYYPNDIFGIEYHGEENPQFLEELYAVEDTRVVACEAFRFLHPCQNLCKRHVDCMIHTISSINNNVSNLKDRTTILCQSKTRTKILTYLKNHAKNKKKYFKIPYNQSELAVFLGLERSALSFELNKLKKEGIIDFDDKLYKIIKKI